MGLIEIITMLRTIKIKYCKVCKIGFKQRISYDRFCSPSCKIKYLNTLKSKTPEKGVIRKPIKKVSKKMVTELQKYKFKRTEFLETYPICQAKLQGCTKGSTQIHHKKGRIGDLLTDTTHFLAVCHSCHHWIELHPLESKELNLSLERY